ncbi:hypothetical protein CYMTET_44076, partial [Cymbomonas tetramitiformis]
VSLTLHHSNTTGPANFSGAVVDQLNEAYSMFPVDHRTHMETSFGHLMGYSANYYTYQWSLAIAMDMKSAFTASPGGMHDKPTALRYRDKILMPGGTKKANELVEDFLERPWNLQAYHDWLSEMPVPSA